jgi:hypothetical protein
MVMARAPKTFLRAMEWGDEMLRDQTLMVNAPQFLHVIG